MGLHFVLNQVYEFWSFAVHDGLTLSTSLFGSTFFVLTGFHGAHVTGGVDLALDPGRARLPGQARPPRLHQGRDRRACTGTSWTSSGSRSSPSSTSSRRSARHGRARHRRQRQHRPTAAGTPPSRPTSRWRIVLAIITAVEVATLYVPGIPNRLLVIEPPRDVRGQVRAGGGLLHALEVRPQHHAGAVHRPARSSPSLIILAIMALFSAFLLLPRPRTRAMAHVVPGPAGPPPLGPEGFDWTSWNADPGVVTGLVVLGAAYAAPSSGGAGSHPRRRVEPRKARLVRAAPCSCSSGRSPGPSTISRTTTSSARTWSSTCCWSSRCRRCCCTARRGGCCARCCATPRCARSGASLTRPSGGLRRFNVVLVAWHLPPALQSGHGAAPDPHRGAPHDHGRLGASSGGRCSRPSRELPRAPYPMQMLYLFVVGLPMVMVAIFITMADGMLYPYYAAAPRDLAALTPRADQHLGGLIMWIPGGLVFLVALSVVFFRWQVRGRRRRGGAPRRGAPWPLGSPAGRRVARRSALSVSCDDARQRRERHRLRARRARTGRSATARVIPPLRPDVLIEYSHRLAARARLRADRGHRPSSTLRGARAPALRRLAWLLLAPARGADRARRHHGAAQAAPT